MTAVKVVRNRYGKPDQPWLVRCTLCVGEQDNGIGTFLSAIWNRDVKGWAKTWRQAQDYAHAHALAHEQTRCTTCLHLPAEPLPSERGAIA